MSGTVRNLLDVVTGHGSEIDVERLSKFNSQLWGSGGLGFKSQHSDRVSGFRVTPRTQYVLKSYLLFFLLLNKLA
jgi:hypothetical protein